MLANKTTLTQQILEREVFKYDLLNQVVQLFVSHNRTVTIT